MATAAPAPSAPAPTIATPFATSETKIARLINSQETLLKPELYSWL